MFSSYQIKEVTSSYSLNPSNMIVSENDRFYLEQKIDIVKERRKGCLPTAGEKREGWEKSFISVSSTRVLGTQVDFVVSENVCRWKRFLSA